jgi:hypothetical protein
MTKVRTLRRAWALMVWLARSVWVDRWIQVMDLLSITQGDE